MKMVQNSFIAVGEEMLDVHSFILCTRTWSNCPVEPASLKLLPPRPRDDVLYIARGYTDSVIYTVGAGQSLLPCGKFLDQFEDEKEGDSIVYYIGLGPKKYGYVTASGKHCHKA